MRIGREIKAPLGAVLGFAHLMAEDHGDPLGERHRRWVVLIEQAAHYMLSLVNESVQLAAASVPAGTAGAGADAHGSPVDVASLLSEVGAWLGAQAWSRQVRVEVGPCEGHVLADARSLRQVLLNLGSNAVKYNRAGGTVRLSAGMTADGTRCVIRVTDDGLGMDEAMRSQLFQPFNRLGRESSGIEGTGLGLVIVRQLVERMRGLIDVSSEPGVGSVFCVTLPAAGASA